MNKRIVSVGDLVVDLITPVSLPILPFQHQEARSLLIEPGGGCNFVIMASRLGADVLAVGALGDDVFGTQLLQVLRAEGVDTRGVTVYPDSRTTVVYALIDLAKKEHVFIGCPGGGPDVYYSDSLDVIIKSGGAIFLQGYNLHERQIESLIANVVERGRLAGIPIYFDVGPTVRHVPFERVRGVVEGSDVLMMTEDELPLAANGRHGESAYEFLLELGPHTLVIKQGAKGCSLVSRDFREYVAGFQVNVVDTVGAGDCFDAAFIYGQLLGFDLRTSARLANATGAASVQKMGAGRNVPTCAEVQAILDEAGVGIQLSC